METGEWKGDWKPRRGRDVMDDRKRALVMGKFKFLYQDETEELETLDKFQLATVQMKLLGPINYKDKDGKSDEVLAIYGETRKEGEGFVDPPLDIPGVLDLFTVVWTNPFGDIFVDQDIKLFEFTDIQKYSGYNEGPKDKAFCQFYTSSASTEYDGFDSSIFWSAGLLWRHFKTCGVEKWDNEFRDLVTHYRNWKDWAHEVHNLPHQKRDRSGQFSNNKFSGPSSSSAVYSRPKQEKRRRDSSPPPKSSLVNDPTKPPKYYPKKSVPSTPKTSVPPPSLPYTPMTTPPPVLSVPPPGQAITIPMMGPDGTTIQVQLTSMPVAGAPPTPVTPLSAEQQPRYNFVNPNFGAGPPPATAAKQDHRWTSAVDDFLHRPKSSTDSSTSMKTKSPSGRKRELIPCQTSSPKRSKDDGFRAKMLAEVKERQKLKKSEETKTKKSSKKFKPKTQIKAPSPSGNEDVNDLDTLPEDKLYIGVIKDWRGKFGFMNCTDIPGKIFLHSKDIKEGLELVGEARLVTFQVLHLDKSVVGAKAVNAIVVK